MLTLTIRTDKPEAEIGLYRDEKQMDYVIWLAHRQLAETLHLKIADMLAVNNMSLQAIDGIACYAGPGSFTGLRIGLSVANSLSYALQASVIAETGDDWLIKSLKKLKAGQHDVLAIPEYGAEVHITPPKTIPR